MNKIVYIDAREEARSKYFVKMCPESILFLRARLSDEAFMAAHYIMLYLGDDHGYVEEINEGTSKEELALVLRVPVEKVDSVMKELFDLGVYRKYRYEGQAKKEPTKWSINPCLGYRGELMADVLIGTFDNTPLSDHFKVLVKQQEEFLAMLS